MSLPNAAPHRKEGFYFPHIVVAPLLALKPISDENLYLVFHCYPSFTGWSRLPFSKYCLEVVKAC